MFSRPALAILGSKSEWETILRKFGKLLFLVSPDETIADYEECYKMCVNHNHFLNAYLFINKTGGKKKTARSPTQPKLTTSRALQRLSVLIMSGFYLNRFQQLPDDHIFASLKVCKIFKHFVAAIQKCKNATNILDLLGYDVALRNWIKESTGSLILHDKKPRAKKSDEQLREYLLPIERNMRNFQTSLESKFETLQEQLREAQNAINSLQEMQRWFSLHKVLLTDFVHEYVGKNEATDNFAQDGNDAEGEDSHEGSDDEMENNENFDTQEIKIQKNLEDEEKNAEEEAEEEEAQEKEEQEESPLKFTGSESEAEVDGDDDSCDE